MRYPPDTVYENLIYKWVLVIRISLTKALVLWWCDNKIDLIWFGLCVSCRFPLYLLFFGVSLLFLLVNLSCALLVKMSHAQVKTVVLVRVAINDSLFVLCAVSLAVCLFKIAKMSLASLYLESKVRNTLQTCPVSIYTGENMISNSIIKT